MIRRLLAGEEVTHDGLVTVDRARLWDLPAGPAAAHRPRGVGRVRGAGGRLGRRARHHQPARRRAARPRRGLPRRRRPRARSRCRCTCRGRRRARRRRRSRSTSGAPTSSPSRSTGTPRPREAFDVMAEHVGIDAVRGAVEVSDDLGVAPRPDRRARVRRLRRRLPPLRRPGAGRLPRRLRRARPARPAGLTPTGGVCLCGSVRVTDTSDLWWKSAVIYCLDVETFYDADGDGTGDLEGLAAAHRLPRGARHHLPVADAVLPEPRPRRRLRPDRLLRRRPAPGQPRPAGRGDPHRPRPRHQRHRRPGRQPHLRPAPVVPGRAAQHVQPLPRPLRLEGHRAAGHLEAGRLPRPGGLHLGARRPHGGVVPPQLLQAPARPQPRQPRGGRRDPAGRRLLAGARLRRLPGRRHPVPGAERQEHRRPGAASSTRTS